MPRDGGLRQLQRLDEKAHAQFGIANQIQDAQAYPLAKRAQQAFHIGTGRVHHFIYSS